MSFLSRILKSKRAEVAERSSRVPVEQLREVATGALVPRDFRAALAGPGLGVITEIKRASPSKGQLRPDLDPCGLARLYQAGGCAAISVLTDSPFFGARPGDLEAARSAVTVPVLRKDFVISEYQLWESRAMGADAVLLIVAAIDEPELARLVGRALEMGLCPLVEIHSEGEVAAARRAEAPVVGINNRDLTTFAVDLETTRRLVPLLRGGTTVVAESGIAGQEEARRVRGWGADAVLVGESVVRSDDPEGLVRSLASVR